MADIAYASKAVTVTNILITDIDYIFGDSYDRMNMFKRSIINVKKKF
jgi:hypothetical protein